MPAIVLFKECHVKVDNNGTSTSTERGAVRILTREGRVYARASVIYTTDTGKVRDLRAWLVGPTGQMRKYGKNEVVEVAAAANDVYNEARINRISASENAEVGSVFIYEWVREERVLFAQEEWGFQNHLPAISARFILTLPEGWHAECHFFNHAGVTPTVSGTTYTWELRGLPFIEDEPTRPPVTKLAPRIAVSYYPPPDTQTPVVTFARWPEVSQWLTQLTNAQATQNGALTAKAQALTAHADSDFARIKAIDAYVQSIQYISIQTGMGRSGEYRPYAAADVLAKSYGDCNDKANLMRVLLSSIGIESYLMPVYAGDPGYVQEQWPSPQQFNHCIIAVKINNEIATPAVINYPELGRLLIFDPTDARWAIARARAG